MNTVIPNSITSIGRWAFSGRSGLTSVEIPNSVTEIDNYVFAYCSDLIEVTIPNSVTKLGGFAFIECSSLTSITIPNSVTSIGQSTFSFCSSLTEVTIPNSVTVIGLAAFSECSNLTEIIIPNGVTEIGDFAFYNCSSLKDLYCHAESVPTVGPETFNNSPISSATLHVPAASVETYKATARWSEFGTIVAIDGPTGIRTLESTGQGADGLPDGKYMENGKIIIMKKGKKYDAAGRYYE